MPRTCSRQLLGGKQPADTPEGYYRRTVYIPFLDHLHKELHTRFDRISNTVLKGFHIIPEIMRRDISLGEGTNVPHWRAEFLEFVHHCDVNFPSERIVRTDLDPTDTMFLGHLYNTVSVTISQGNKTLKTFLLGALVPRARNKKQ